VGEAISGPELEVRMAISKAKTQFMKE